MAFKTKTLIALLVFTLSGLAFFFWPLERLKISYQDKFCYLEDTSFILQWRHSVELQDWQEHYRLSSGRLFLDASYMQTFGAGTPSSGEVIDAPEGYVGLRSEVVLPSLHWIVSRNMQGKIITQQGTWDIYQLVPDYTEVEIQPSKAARIFFWLGNNCYDYGYFSDDYNQ
ncbi:MAG: DUF1850 domain-containing protein [Alcaligenaceae bacterium]|jgi:hypothetical protein|nr:DUF1850 domain-containing protein [Alcaligenaceae bacterium]